MIAGKVKARFFAVVLGAAALVACGQDSGEPASEGSTVTGAMDVDSRGPDELVAPLSPLGASQGWTVEQSAGGVRLVYDPVDAAVDAPDDPVLVLTCTGGGRLIVRLPRVAPIGSEERLSIGSGDDVAALVADPGNEVGGIAGRGPVPEALPEMLEAGFAATYGAYSTGVLPPVPVDSIAAMRSACN
ncbi:hypothetical protein MUY73_06985 [Sphingomicrobium aestuariivivum]|nr:hypothetical protein [Sphingomicrobium aestuariivivum]MCJ8191084.1 hypothetical protein [Sphingomicrobium aestuariivivum]